MPKVHISQNQTGQFNANAADTTWIIDKDVTLTSANDFCFRSTFENTDVILRGTLDHTSMFGSAIGLAGMGGGLTIARSGKIESETTGIYLSGDKLELVNQGLVTGLRGVVVDGDETRVENRGEIVATGFAGVDLGGMDGALFNARGAMIRGEVGIDTEGSSGEQTRIDNFGTIKGVSWAISCGDGVDHIVNRGRIVGSVELGNGQNVFDNRGGTVIGDVSGGLDGDTYLIDDADVAIFEGAGGGYDTLKSTVSYALDANNEIEVVTAIGDKNVSLSGNAIGNRLNGNKGDNALKGRGGDDWLDGGRGDDVLTGGTGLDHFVFKKGGDNDIVKGFVSGEDILYVENFYLDKGYDDLLDHMTVVKGDLVIRFGKDSITLEGMGSADLAETDVTFANL